MFAIVLSDSNSSVSNELLLDCLFHRDDDECCYVFTGTRVGNLSTAYFLVDYGKSIPCDSQLW